MAKYISQLPSGLAKFTFTDEDGDVFAAFRLNMTDPRTADRLQKFQQELTSMQEPDGSADISAFIAFEYAIEEKFCKFLGYDCKEELFGVLAATSILEDGRFFCIAVLETMAEKIGTEIQKRQQSMKKAVEKYTAKYDRA